MDEQQRAAMIAEAMGVLARCEEMPCKNVQVAMVTYANLAAGKPTTLTIELIAAALFGWRLRGLIENEEVAL